MEDAESLALLLRMVRAALQLPSPPPKAATSATSPPLPPQAAPSRGQERQAEPAVSPGRPGMRQTTLTQRGRLSAAEAGADQCRPEKSPRTKEPVEAQGPRASRRRSTPSMKDDPE